LQGAGFDLAEENQIQNEEQLASLKIQNLANVRQLARVQRQLDGAIENPGATSVYQVYFDSDASNLRAGAVANLEVIAESIRKNPAALRVFVIGHADDSGNPEYNQRTAEARARTVAAYLGQRGLSMGQIVVEAHGSTRPIASNASPEGRQLNRRVDIYAGK
jgi:outer membrane protein OmpA-like peptidoglycan-associated protein